MTPSDVLKLIQDEKVEYVDLRFTDLPGLWQHVTFPAHRFEEDTFESGRV